jgi:type I restriction enzyme R subunit
MRPINSMIEFKQIIGRGTRIFDGKEYFTILDFVDAYRLFMDKDWDGEPLEDIVEKEPRKINGETKEPMMKPEPEEPGEPKKKIKIKLRDGKEREIQHMISTSFWSADGKPISAEELLRGMFGKLSEFFTNEDQLRSIWSNPKTRKSFLANISDAGYGKTELEALQKMIDAEDSDIFDVLAYVAFAIPPITRKQRADGAKENIFDDAEEEQRDFLDFVLRKYIEKGSEELGEEKLPKLLGLKYNSISDAERNLGGVQKIRARFLDLQKDLYKVISR